jgi:lysophospholipase L1-like esterase
MAIVTRREEPDERQPGGGRQMKELHQSKSEHSCLVVCVGDSLVRGQVSVNFVDILRHRMGADGFRFVNAGINGDLAYNVLMRLDMVVAQKPDFVVTLAGTNDVNATLSGKAARFYRLYKRLPQPPTPEWYRDNVIQIVRLLKEKTSASIALASPPVLGEALASLPNERIRAYSGLLKEIAAQEQVRYVPVHERQEEYLREVQHTEGRPHDSSIMLVLTSFLRHYVLRRSFDTISRQNGFHLTVEGIHLNSRGAGIVADEIEAFLRASVSLPPVVR